MRSRFRPLDSLFHSPDTSAWPTARSADGTRVLNASQIASSLSSLKKSAFQCHCRPAGQIPSNIPWSIGKRHRHKELISRPAVAANRFQNRIRLLHGTLTAPHDAAHLTEGQVLREGRTRRYGQHREEAVHFFRRLRYELAVPLHHVRGIFQIPEHRTGANGADGVRLEQKRGHNREVPASAPDRPEQVGILIGDCHYEAAVRALPAWKQQEILHHATRLRRQTADWRPCGV